MAYNRGERPDSPMKRRGGRRRKKVCVFCGKENNEIDYKDVAKLRKYSSERGKRMNKVILMGRLTRDPEVRYSAGENSTAVARYTLAVDRRFRRNNDGEQTADFIGCVAFGRSAEFAEKYFRQGLKVIVTGRIQTGSYTNKDGQRVYTTDVVVEDQEFAESKAASESHMNGGFQAAPAPAPSAPAGDGFMNIPDGIDEELPFN